MIVVEDKFLTLEIGLVCSTIIAPVPMKFWCTHILIYCRILDEIGRVSSLQFWSIFSIRHSCIKDSLLMNCVIRSRSLFKIGKFIKKSVCHFYTTFVDHPVGLALVAVRLKALYVRNLRLLHWFESSRLSGSSFSV